MLFDENRTGVCRIREIEKFLLIVCEIVNLSKNKLDRINKSLINSSFFVQNFRVRFCNGVSS